MYGAQIRINISCLLCAQTTKVTTYPVQPRVTAMFAFMRDGHEAFFSCSKFTYGWQEKYVCCCLLLYTQLDCCQQYSSTKTMLCVCKNIYQQHRATLSSLWKAGLGRRGGLHSRSNFHIGSNPMNVFSSPSTAQQTIIIIMLKNRLGDLRVV